MFTYLIVRSSLTVSFRQVMAKIKTFAFLDLETTGLPSMENNKTRITELTVMTVHSEHLLLGVVPRVQNKLSLCFNPWKLICPETERITGLSNYVLEHLAPFTSNTVQMLNSFLEHNPKPICLVAHHGDGFDYPILRTEIERTGENLAKDILCIDSLKAFRELHIQESKETELMEMPNSLECAPLEFMDGFNEVLCKALDEHEAATAPAKKGVKRALDIQKINETTPPKLIKHLSEDAVDLYLTQRVNNTMKYENLGSKNNKGEHHKSKKLKIVGSRKKLDFGISFKLGDVYQRLTNKKVTNAHQAESDVLMLAMCAATVGDKFVDWANDNAQNFTNIPMMVPGKKIGT